MGLFNPFHLLSKSFPSFHFLDQKLMQHCFVARRRDCFPCFIDVRTGGRPLNRRIGQLFESLAVPFASGVRNQSNKEIEIA